MARYVNSTRGTSSKKAEKDGKKVKHNPGEYVFTAQ